MRGCMLVLEVAPNTMIIDNPRLIIGVNIELQSGAGTRIVGHTGFCEKWYEFG
jgi:hypothetical protein